MSSLTEKYINITGDTELVNIISDYIRLYQILEDIT